ncbi:hypothetical protein [Salinarimonas soli]|nr:hypothetical protein [Salinarimonas soli]
MLIDAGAAPACGSQGAARVAAKTAAIETIRAGYDRYIIAGGAAQNNVSVSQMPGSYQTAGTMNYGRGYGSYNATTTYVPGPTIVAGSHDRQLSVVMFREGEPGAEQAIDAKSALGPEWQDLVKSGVRTCL